MGTHEMVPVDIVVVVVLLRWWKMLVHKNGGVVWFSWSDCEKPNWVEYNQMVFGITTKWSTIN